MILPVPAPAPEDPPPPPDAPEPVQGPVEVYDPKVHGPKKGAKGNGRLGIGPVPGAAQK